MINASLKEINFTSSFDKLVISAVAAIPSGEINGVVQIVHGIHEYKERYYDFMDYLAENGFLSVIHDNRGHGKSIVNEDDLGFFFKNGGEGFVSDIIQLNSIIRTARPSLPCFMLANDIGSLGARCFLKKNDIDLSGLIIMGSPSYKRFSDFERAVKFALLRKENSRFRSEKLSVLSENKLSRKFGTSKNSWMCSQKNVVSEMNENPLSNFEYTLNGCEAVLYLLKETYCRNDWKVANPQLPVRFISGKEDALMISEKKFFSSVELMRKTGYESISHRLFDNMRHDLMNEKNNITVYRDIVKTFFSWIDRINSI